MGEGTRLPKVNARVGAACIISKRSSMKLVWVRDEYLKPIAVASYVTWGRAVAAARARLSMADIGKG
jgi:hypothetical protein